MMDYEGIVRASARAHAPKTAAGGAMGVVTVGRAAAPASHQAQQQQSQSAPAQQRRQFGGSSSYPIAMAMR